MKITRITPFYSVAPQISEADLDTVAAQGFRTVVNNRPDGEAEDQPDNATLAAAAEKVGLDYCHAPVTLGKVSDDDVATFTATLDEIEGPVLAFCRTGTRSMILWALAEAHHLDPDTILEAARRAGYDLAAVRPRLEARHTNR